MESPVKKPIFTLVGMDDWSRLLYKSAKTGIFYVLVDGFMHDITDWGEPNTPIRSIDSVEVENAKVQNNAG